MNITAVSANPDQSSLSGQIFHEISAILKMHAHTVFYQDLYADHFNPVLTKEEIDRRFSLDNEVSRYAGELVSSEGIIIVHPDWWGGPPAILKGWVDRVFRPGIAYDTDRDFPGDPGTHQPLLAGKHAIVVCLSDNKADNEILRVFWEDKVFSWCGLKDFRMFHLNDMSFRSYEEIADWKRLVVKDSIRFLTGEVIKNVV